MSDASAALPVNHHADQPGFAGIIGTVFGIVFLITGRRSGRLAADLARVSVGDHVVDVGCGPGTAARTAVRRGARVIGVDPSAAMLRWARAIGGDRHALTYAQGSAEALPVQDASATVVWALATVHHWPDVPAGLAEARRVLAPGGRLLALERQSEPGATGRASHGWTADQVESFAALCRAAGFIDVAVGDHRSGRGAFWSVSGRHVAEPEVPAP